jgi:hypothetical protein
MSDADVIRIEYCVRPIASGGFIPHVRHTGREWTWLRSWPIDEDQARCEARLAAQEEAGHYSGDWDVKVSEAPDLDIRP